MREQILDYARSNMGSPWTYLIIARYVPGGRTGIAAVRALLIEIGRRIFSRADDGGDRDNPDALAGAGR